MLRKLQKRVWKGAGIPPVPYLFEMPGELKKDMDYKNEKHEKAMKAWLIKMRLERQVGNGLE